MEEELLFMSKRLVPIPGLGLMNDNLTVSEAGHKVEQVNAFLNENAAEKNLQFNPKKCKFICICRNKENVSLHKLEVDTLYAINEYAFNLVETEGIKKNMIAVRKINVLCLNWQKVRAICKISKIRHNDFFHSFSVTLRVPPLDSETGWTGELWSNRVLLILENLEDSIFKKNLKKN